MKFFCTFFILIKIKNQRHLDSNSFLTQILYSTEIVKEKKSQTTTNFYGGNVCHYKIVDVCIPASHYIVKSCTETEEVLTSVVIKISSDDIDQYLPLAMWNLGSRWRHFFWDFPSGIIESQSQSFCQTMDLNSVIFQGFSLWRHTESQSQSIFLPPI